MEKCSRHKTVINNEFYDALQEEWYTRSDHPIALLRAENRIRTPWVAKEIETRLGTDAQQLLDIGCGAGFLTNHLAVLGHTVTGLDISMDSLKVATQHDYSGNVTYIHANAYSLPLPDASFNVVCAMDILEHVENPLQLIHEASRVLKPGGLFFFHTFNRTWLSYLLVIKGVDWFVKNAPKNMHVYELFISPSEIKTMCSNENLVVDSFVGLVPQVWNKAFWQMLGTREVPDDFCFAFSKNLLTGYCGIAKKLDQ